MLVVRAVKDGRVTEAELELEYGEASANRPGPDRFDVLLARARASLRAFEARIFNRR